MSIEYNGLLAVRGFEKAVYQETAGLLLQAFNTHDEFMFGAITEESNYENLIKAQIHQAQFFTDKTSQTWFVDLDGFTDGVDGYLSTVSKNRRAQIRRSIHLYENEGSLQIDEAQILQEAQAFFDGLKVLHTNRWLSKGQLQYH